MRAPRTAEALGLLAGFLLWGLAFVTLYAVHGFACSTGMQDSVTRTALIALFLGFVAAHIWLAWHYWLRLRPALEPPLALVRLISFVLALAALATTVWTGSPVLLLSICR